MLAIDGGQAVDRRTTLSAVMNLKEAAEYLGISKAHLSNVINGKVRGVPPVRSVRVGRCIRLKREWLDEWLDAAAREGAAKC